MAVKKAVQSGNVEDAIEKVNDLNPEVVINIFLWLSLWFMQRKGLRGCHKCGTYILSRHFYNLAHNHR